MEGTPVSGKTLGLGDAPLLGEALKDIPSIHTKRFKAMEPR